MQYFSDKRFVAAREKRDMKLIGLLLGKVPVKQMTFHIEDEASPSIAMEEEDAGMALLQAAASAVSAVLFALHSSFSK